MLTLNTQIPTLLRGKVRAMVKAHRQWRAFLDEKQMLSSAARNRDLIEFALRHKTLRQAIEGMLAGYEASLRAAPRAMWSSSTIAEVEHMLRQLKLLHETQTMH